MNEIYYHSSENMDEIEDGSIDCVVTSPPYNRGKNYGKYSDNLPESDYLALIGRVFSETLKKMSKKGVFFLNIGNNAKDMGKSEKVLAEAEKAGFIHVSTVIWVKSLLGKGHFSPINSRKKLAGLWENIYILVKDRKEYEIFPLEIGIEYADKKNIKRYGRDKRDAGDVWFIPYERTLSKTVKGYSPCPFPVDLPLRAIKLTKTGAVLDPFAGSCNTLLAAKIAGIKGIAYEAYPDKESIEANLEREVNITPIILIPHLYKAISFLNKFSSFSPVSTKKDLQDLSITNSVLFKLGLPSLD